MAKVTGGDKFKKAVDEIRRKLAKAKGLKVGFMAGETYPDGTSVPMVAAINEFGAPSRKQPPRPFFRNMIRAKHAEWPVALTNYLKANDYDVERSLEQLGQGVAGQLIESINELVDPPLSPITIKRKGFDKPLIDTVHMRNSVTFEVLK